MKRLRVVVGLAVAGGALGAVLATGATTAQLTQKCRAAWKGEVPSAAYTAYRGKCVKAGAAAVDAATDAGDPTAAKANRARANAACRTQFPPPRATAAKKSAFAACVTAAIGSQSAFAGRPLTADLSGANEVPPTGSNAGTASIRLNQGRNRVCYTLTPASPFGSPVTVAHIHEGKAGASGPPVVSLESLAGLDAGSPAKGCAENVDAKLIQRIRKTPGDFYVNIHTQAFPGGALRGQLSK